MSENANEQSKVATPSQNQTTPTQVQADAKVEEVANINSLPEDPEENKEVDLEALVPIGDYRADPLFYSVADYFNIQAEDYPQAKEYISEIVDFAIRETKSNDPTKLLVKIREIEDKVQTPQWGEKRYWNIRKYVRLASRKSDIEKAMTAFVKKV